METEHDPKRAAEHYAALAAQAAEPEPEPDADGWRVLGPVAYVDDGSGTRLEPGLLAWRPLRPGGE